MAATGAGVTSQGWPNTKDDYELKEVIGVGGISVVHGAFCKPRQEICAIKRINFENWNTSMDELLKEIQAMSSCNHKNMVTYYTSFVVRKELWLVLRLLESGSMLDIIKHKMLTSNCYHGVFDECIIATVLKEVLKGLEYFHSNGLIHKNIKAGNILLGENGNIQISDFGVSSRLDKDLSRQNMQHTFIGSSCWMAPEVMEQIHGYDFKADIWSFGITAIEIATGATPYHKYPPMKELMMTLQNDPPTLDTGAEEENQYDVYGKCFRKMIVRCLQKDPSKRPTATELLKHPFFKKAKDRKYLRQTLVAIGPSLETRIQRASKHRLCTSGRLHRTVTGEWVWSSGEVIGECSDEESAEKILKNIEIVDFSESEIDLAEEPEESVETADKAEAETETATISQETHSTSRVQSIIPPVSVVLRLRNRKQELIDINFAFAVGKDSTEGIASEMVGARLVNVRDIRVIATNLQKLIDSSGQIHILTFPLNSCHDNIHVPDDKALIGFAQIFVAD